MRPFVDAYNATDNPSGHAHCSSLSVAIALRQAGAEPVMQVACRDRNRLALQADLMGASMHGVTNISCMTGDDVTAGDEPEARRVFDLDGPQLITLARALQNGRYLSGRAFSPAPHFFIGAVENPGTPPFEYRVRRAAMKVAAGARFLQLQICYRPEQLERFMRRRARHRAHRALALIPSICLLRDRGAMRFVDEQVPGVDVPRRRSRESSRRSTPSTNASRSPTSSASHALAQPGVAGLHFISFRKDAGSPSFRRDNAIPRLCEDLGLHVGDRTPTRSRWRRDRRDAARSLPERRARDHLRARAAARRRRRGRARPGREPRVRRRAQHHRSAVRPARACRRSRRPRSWCRRAGARSCTR